MKSVPKTYETTYLKRVKESQDAYSFYFKKPKGFNFSSGQYIKLSLEIKNPNGRGTSRYFTISSSPTDKDFFTITTKIIKSSFKKKLMSLKENELVKFYGPIGYFDFDYRNKSQNVFLAGGIGITPFHSIIKFIENKKLNSKILLIASFKTKEDTIFYDKIRRIESKNKNIKIVYTLTKEQKKYSEFENGGIDANLIKKYVQSPLKSSFFITGPAKMTDELFDLVKKMGVSEKGIFKEDFSGY